MKITRFEDLECWKEARVLTRIVYVLAKKNEFSRDLRFVGQVTAAAVSVMNNIAEGFDSQQNNEFMRFLRISRRSISEVQNCCYVAIDQKYITDKEFNETYEQAGKTRKLVDGMLRYLNQHKKLKRL